MSVEVDKHLDRAKRHLERNKLEDAAEAYQAVLNEMPGHVEALQALGDIYARVGQLDRATSYYGVLFDRFFDAHEENKALAIYTRTLKGIQQPPERMARYALLLQKQNRAEEAIEQYSLASELFLAQGKGEPALDCLGRIAQLDPENAARQCAIADLAEQLGKHTAAARGYLRAGQLAEAAGDVEGGLEMLSRAHQLVPGERAPALLYAQALLRRDNPQAAVQLLDPFSNSDVDPAFLSTFGEALARIDDLDRAREILERLPIAHPEAVARLFDLADRFLSHQRDEEARKVLTGVQEKMASIGRQNDFAARLDVLGEGHPASIVLADVCANTYAAMNREAKYFDALVHLFDLCLEGGDIQRACEVFEKLVDIDPYDARNEERITKLDGRADPQFVSRMQNRLGRTVAAQPAEPQPVEPSGSDQPSAPDANAGRQSIDDLLVQAEIFLQYSLQAKAVERLQKIAELFPEEINQNERLRQLFQLANWWPEGATADKSRSEDLQASLRVADSADTMRDLAKISEISRVLFRLPTARAILSAGINEVGNHMRATRCIAVIGAAGKPPQLASEFCAAGVQAAAGAVVVRLLAQLEHAAPDALGGLPLEAAAAPLLRELGLETVLGVVLSDRDTQAQAGVIVAGFDKPHAWRPHETYFLQAVGDQILLGVNHTRLRTLARTVGVADEQSGLLARGSYQECLLSESRRARSQGTPLALVLIQVDHGHDLLRQHGDDHMERFIQQLSRVFRDLIRQTDMAVKYNSWTIAFILPDTGLAGAQTLEGKLRKAAANVQAPWDGSHVTLSASIAEAVARPDYDLEDIVTELINRAEAGLEEAHNRGGDSVVALSLATT